MSGLERNNKSEGKMVQRMQIFKRHNYLKNKNRNRMMGHKNKREGGMQIRSAMGGRNPQTVEERERENHSFHFPVRHMKTVYSLEHQN